MLDQVRVEKQTQHLRHLTGIKFDHRSSRDRGRWLLLRYHTNPEAESHLEPPAAELGPTGGCGGQQELLASPLSRIC